MSDPASDLHLRGQAIMRQLQRATGTIDKRLTETEIELLRIVGFCVDTLLRPETRDERAPVLKKLVDDLRDNDLVAALELIARKSRILAASATAEPDPELELMFLTCVVAELKQIDPHFADLEPQVLKRELLGLRSDDPTSVARALTTLAQASGALKFGEPGGSDQGKRKKLMSRIRSARKDRKKRSLPIGRDLSDLLPTFEARGTAIDDVNRKLELRAIGAPSSVTPEPSGSAAST